MMVPVIDLYKLLKNPKEISECKKRISVDKILGLSRPIQRSEKYLRALIEVLKDKQKRNYLFDKSPVAVYEYNKNYYVLNGNHRCYLFKKYKKQIGVEFIPARVIKIVESDE